MAYKKVSLDHMIRGTLLAIVEHLFPGSPPTVAEYARDSGVAASTFRRGATWLLGLLPGLFGARKPGPNDGVQEPQREAREEALRKLEDLRAFLVDNRAATKRNRCYTGEGKQRIATVAEEIRASGVLTYGEIAAALGMDERQLSRIRKEVEAAGGAAPESRSRRPKRTGELSEKIQELIENIKRSADDRSAYTAADVTRILNKNYKKELLEQHGSETISETTVRKYLSKEERTEGAEKVDEHPRGSWQYPEPFQQVAIDTSYFKLFGVTFYIITVFDFGGRLNLITRVFLRDNTASVVRVLEEYLEKFPGVEVLVIDRGTPYLNDEVKALLERNGRLRIVSPPYTPTAKAAAERHFKTLKAVLRPAIEKVFPRDPSWPPARIAKILEMGAAVFQELYHQIPQQGIDGKTPAERIQSFDPVKAAAELVNLFQRARDSEPSEDYCRHLHAHFQLPGTVEETVKKLGKFSTRTLRLLFKRVSPYMGPPHPEWLYDPLGFLCAKAREIHEAEQAEFRRQKLFAETRKRDSQEHHERLAKLQEEARQREEQPERSIDAVLRVLVRCVEAKFLSGLRILKAQLAQHLVALSRRLGAAFSSELRRLKTRIGAFTASSTACHEAESIVDDQAAALPGGNS